MHINNIKDIKNNGSNLDVILNVDFDLEKGNRWELTDPTVIVEYSKDNGGEVKRAELIDNGMKVHGYDFSSTEVKQLEKYLQEKIT